MLEPPLLKKQTNIKTNQTDHTGALFFSLFVFEYGRSVYLEVITTRKKKEVWYGNWENKNSELSREKENVRVSARPREHGETQTHSVLLLSPSLSPSLDCCNERAAERKI